MASQKTLSAKQVGNLKAFSSVWNNTKSFSDLASLASELSTTIAQLRRKATRYEKTREKHPEANLPALKTRRVHTVSVSEAVKLGLGRDETLLPSKSKVFVLTGAQPGAPYNKKCLEALQLYCQTRGNAQLFVGRIANNKPEGWKFGTRKRDAYTKMAKKFADFLPDGFDVDEMQTVDPQIHKDLRPYLVDGAVKINSNLYFDTTMDIRATTKRPTSSLEPSHDLTSFIYPHPKLELKFVPRSSEAKMPKALMTTGAITFPNYRQGKAGKVAARDHCFSAVVVEVTSRGRFYFRQLLMDKNGVFHDIVPTVDKAGKTTVRPVRFSPNKAEVIDGVDSVIYGDWHTTWTSKRVRRMVLGKGGMVECLRPKYQVFHDFTDGYAISHHHEKDPQLQAIKNREGRDSLEWELDQNLKEMDDIRKASPFTKEFIMVKSNHDEHPERWIKEARYINDRVNYFIGHKLVPWQVEGATCVLEYFAKLKNFDTSKFKFLSRDEDFTRYGVKLDMHGDQGANGARGSIMHFAKLALRCVIGHNHTGGIHDLVWSVGTSTPFKLEYTSGPTSWTNMHCIIYPGGQRQMVVMLEDGWHGGLPC